MSGPTVSVILPVLNEEAHLGETLESVLAQRYDGLVEILVVDGGSTDGTRAVAASTPNVRVLDNPRRIQAAALNIGLAGAIGDIIVRVDGHCQIAPDYLERCVAGLARPEVALVGGAMRPTGIADTQRAIAIAMRSRLGAGPARFHVDGSAGPVETVYLGAFRASDARAIGGYAEDVGVNEDAEFAIRMSARGLVWFDPAIRSRYTPRASLRALGKQFFRYGWSRAATARRHPDHVKLRQLAAPLLIVGLVSPWRRAVAATYLGVVILKTASVARRDGPAARALACVLPTMHLAWGTGFLYGLARDGLTRNRSTFRPEGAAAPGPGMRR